MIGSTSLGLVAHGISNLIVSVKKTCKPNKARFLNPNLQKSYRSQILPKYTCYCYKLVGP